MGVSRRQVLTGLAALGVLGIGAGGARYWLGRPRHVTTHDYELIAAPLDVELVPGFTTTAWAYGGQVPGVELRCRQGERLTLESDGRATGVSVLLRSHRAAGKVTNGRVARETQEGLMIEWTDPAKPLGLTLL